MTKETKIKLFRLKSRFEHDEGHAINYDELIQILIRNTQQLRARVPLSEFRKLKGILSDRVDAEFEKEREIDRLSEESKGEG